jgi:hypothetical protein
VHGLRNPRSPLKGECFLRRCQSACIQLVRPVRVAYGHSPCATPSVPPTVAFAVRARGPPPRAPAAVTVAAFTVVAARVGKFSL